MKLYLTAIIIVFMGVILGLLIVLKASEKPQAVVETFIEALIQNDNRKMESLVTTEPAYVYQRKLEQLEINSKGTVSPTPTHSKSNILVGKLPPQSTPKEIIKSFMPTALIDNNRHLIEISFVKEVEKEARVRVKMGNKELADLEFDFLLYKENDEWKIFEIQPVTTLIKDAYSFYAN